MVHVVTGDRSDDDLEAIVHTLQRALLTRLFPYSSAAPLHLWHWALSRLGPAYQHEREVCCLLAR